MKSKSSPKRLALITTLTLVAINIISLFLFFLIYNQIGSIAFVLGIITVTVFTYYIIYKTIDSFIYRKIKLIYKNIHRLKRGKSINESELRSQSDLLESVNEEVIEWAKIQKAEIQNMKTLEEYRRNFVGNVSHELKTPIFNIQGYILTLLDGGLYDENINRKYLKKANKSVDRMINMIKDLETISFLESGIVAIQPFNFNLAELAVDVVDFLEVKANKKKISLHLAKGNQQQPVFVYADKEQIRQVFINLVDNAINYMGDNPNPFIKISFYDMDENILVEISDNGLGVAEENIPFLFDRFYRVDKSRSRDKGGTGLGLAIVKHIIEAHKQIINVRSSLGIGTTFSFTLKKDTRAVGIINSML